MQVTGAINEYVQKKVGHAIDPYKTVVQDVDVRLSVRGGDASRGERFVCTHAAGHKSGLRMVSLVARLHQGECADGNIATCRSFDK